MARFLADLPNQIRVHYSTAHTCPQPQPRWCPQACYEILVDLRQIAPELQQLSHICPLHFLRHKSTIACSCAESSSHRTSYLEHAGGIADTIQQRMTCTFSTSSAGWQSRATFPVHLVFVAAPGSASVWMEQECQDHCISRASSLLTRSQATRIRSTLRFQTFNRLQNHRAYEGVLWWCIIIYAYICVLSSFGTF